MSKHYSFKCGNVDCTVLLDGSMLMGMPRILRAFPEANEEQYRQAYAEIGLSLDEADLSSNILLMKISEETVLIDAGEAGKPNGGLLLKSMKQANIDPASISLIVITHSHRDHVQGLLSDDNQAEFPNARYVISRIEMAFWQAAIDNGQAAHSPIVSMMQAKGLRLIDLNEQIIPGLRAIPLTGHTPGQIGILLESEGQSLIHLADMLHTPMQFAHPEWSASADVDTTISVPTRRNMLKQVSEENNLVLYYHLTFPGLGYVAQSDDTFVWNPLMI